MKNLMRGSVGLLFASVLWGCGPEPQAEPEGPPVSGPDMSEYVVTPNGFWHHSCVHEVPEGAVSRTDRAGQLEVLMKDTVIAKHPPCRFPVVNAGKRGNDPSTINVNWKAYDMAIAQPNMFGYDWFSYIDSTWTVPPAPPVYKGQTIYLFNSLASDNFILQPVLQYGESPGGQGGGMGDLSGGKFWAMASWQVSETRGWTTHTPIVPVNQGDTIVGWTGITTPNCHPHGLDCFWNVGFRINNGPVHEMNLLVLEEKVRFASKGVLEVVRLFPIRDAPTCSQLPGANSGVIFKNAHLGMQGPTTAEYNEMVSSVSWDPTHVVHDLCIYNAGESSNGVGDTMFLSWRR
jgi:hypothetical protein